MIILSFIFYEAMRISWLRYQRNIPAGFYDWFYGHTLTTCMYAIFQFKKERAHSYLFRLWKPCNNLVFMSIFSSSKYENYYLNFSCWSAIHMLTCTVPYILILQYPTHHSHSISNRVTIDWSISCNQLFWFFIPK